MKCKLGDIVEVTMGQSPKSEFYNADGNGTPFLQGNRTFGSKYPTFDTFTTFVTKQGRAGDVIMSVRAPVGDVNITPVDICLGRGVCSLRMKNGSQEFLYYMMRHYAQALINRESGTVFGSVNKNDVNGLDVEVPSEETQRKIAAILSALDDKIELNRRVNANLEQQAAAIYSQMFVETPNNDRKIVPAGEFFDISIGKTPPRKELRWFSENPEDCVWVSISDMGNCGLYIGESSEYLTREAVDKHNVKIVPDNTVILSFKLTVGRVAITDGELTTNEAIAHFKTDFPKINEYLYFYLKYFNYNELGSTSSIATAVNSKIVKTLPFVVPTDDEIERFHQIAAVFFEQIKTNQYEIVRLTAVRDALLPRLMSGEIDVSDVSL